MDTKSFEQRLDLILRGRKIHPWSAALGISRGIAQRLKEGSFPDPAKLTNACIVENLSLSWLIYGIGTPYTLQVATDGANAFEIIAKQMAESQWNILFAHSSAGWVPVLHQPGDVTLPDNSILDYLRVQVISGSVDGCQQLLLNRLNRAWNGRWGSLLMRPHDWRRLATGYMGPIELFEHAAEIAHSFEGHAELPRSMGLQIAEPGAIYSGHTAAEREALEIIRGLDHHDQSAALRMLRGMMIKPE